MIGPSDRVEGLGLGFIEFRVEGLGLKVSGPQTLVVP